MSKKIIAIDFGTSNTYLSTHSGDGSVEDLSINVGGDDRRGITSAILYKNSGSHKGEHEYGEDAVSIIGGASKKKRIENGLEFHANFKPDIATSPEAERYAKDFLSFVLKAADNQNLNLNPDSSDVIFGVPSEASEKYKETLKRIARNAGWGNIRLLDEPFGALCSYQNERSSDTVDRILGENVLVIDFGGGTCDFAILQNGVIENSWGDMLLGGRLFDDLFYQWLLDETKKTATPITEDTLIAANRDFYCRTIQARLLKEKFSNRMVNSKTTPFEEYETISLGEKGSVSVELSLTWSEFQKRAHSYVQSKSFREKTPLPKNIYSIGYSQNQSMDLFKWFNDELLKGFHEADVSVEIIDKVLLAGGSSMWPFVREKCKELFGEEKLERCDNPFSAISKGLAKYMIIKNRAGDKISVLRNDSARIEAEIMKDIEKSPFFDQKKSDIKNTGNVIFKRFILPELDTFRQKGGTTANLEERVKKSVENNSSEISVLYQPIFHSLATTIVMQTKDKLKKWFKDHDISSQTFDMDSHKVEIPIIDNFANNIEVRFNKLGAVIGAAIGLGIVAVITLASSTITGPMGWVIAPFVALIAAGGGAKAIQHLPIPSILSQYLLTTAGVEEFREKFLEEFSAGFQKEFEEFFKKNESVIRTEIGNTVEQAVEKLQKIIDMEKSN